MFPHLFFSLPNVSARFRMFRHVSACVPHVFRMRPAFVRMRSACAATFLNTVVKVVRVPSPNLRRPARETVP